MKRLILICAVLVLVQTGLVMLTHGNRQGAEIQTGKGRCSSRLRSRWTSCGRRMARAAS